MEFTDRKIWKILNSPIILLLLSGMALSVVPFVYTNRLQHNAAATKLERVRFELGYRIQQWKNYSSDPTVQQAYKADITSFVDVLLRPPNVSAPIAPTYPVYGEFATLSLVGVLAEGQALEASATSNAKFSNAVRATSHFRLIVRTSTPADATLPQLADWFIGVTSLEQWAFGPQPPFTPGGVQVR